jgi:hypothetical protein
MTEISIILTYDPHPPSIAATKPETKKQGEQRGIRIYKEIRVLSRYYASAQSCARTPEEG